MAPSMPPPCNQAQMLLLQKLCWWLHVNRHCHVLVHNQRKETEIAHKKHAYNEAKSCFHSPEHAAAMIQLSLSHGRGNKKAFW